MANDWADEIASNVFSEHGHDVGYLTDGYAAALRKAKADGVRWAADVLGQPPLGVPHDKLKDWADKIERGE